MFASIIWASDSFAKVVILISSVLLFASIGMNFFLFFKEYNSALQRCEYFYVDSIKVHISWMINSVYCVVGVAVLASIVAFSTLIPKVFLFLFLVYFVSVCIYIFNKFLGFMVIFAEPIEGNKTGDMIPDVDVTKVQLPPEIYQNIHSQVNDWINAKEFCKAKVSIQSTALSMNTNRLYLSQYINNTFKCSFRVWISRLRVEEAKRLLLLDPTVSITSISEMVGFLSLTSFTHAFTNFEGMPPKKWRVYHLKYPNNQ